jgi:hypothetical protein
MKMSKRSVLLFGAVLSVCAFVVPSMASAASWQTISTTHQLFSPDLSFTTVIGGVVHAGSSCAASEFHADVVSASRIEITSGNFANCTGTQNAGGCTVTATGRNFPWTATAPTTTNIQIHNVHVSVTFETRPPAGSIACGFTGAQVTLTGTLTGGSWDPSATGSARRVTYTNGSGLTAHQVGGGSSAAFVIGSIRDTTGTLNLVD